MGEVAGGSAARSPALPQPPSPPSGLCTVCHPLPRPVLLPSYRAEAGKGGAEPEADGGGGGWALEAERKVRTAVWRGRGGSC